MFKILNKYKFTFTKIKNNSYLNNCFNKNILNFNNKLFCNKEVESKLNEYFTQNANKIDITQFEKKSIEASDLLKVLNTKFDTLDVEYLIKTLLLCANFRNYPPELLIKLEKRLSKYIIAMTEDQIVRTMMGFTLINHKSNSLAFNLERILGRNLMSYNKTSFISIFKCMSKYTQITFSQNLILVLRNYIEKNMNKFNLNDLCDIFLHYPKLLKNTPETKDTELFAQVFSQILPFIENLDLNRLSSLYFLLYSDKSKNKIVHKLFEGLNYPYIQSFYNKFSTQIDNVNTKIIYQIILTHHFSNSTLSTNEYFEIEEKFKSFVLSISLKLIHQFTPEEINSIMTIFIQNKQVFKLNDEEFKSILNEFVELTKIDSEKMNVDELIMYMQTILIALKDNKEIEDCLFDLQDKLMNKISYFDLFQTSSLLELIHHFKKHLSLEKYFSKIDLDSLTNNLIRVLNLKSGDDVLRIFDDYYLIYLFLFDLKYDNKEFWRELTQISKLFFSDYEDEKFAHFKLFFKSRKANLEKLRILIDIKMKEYKI